MIFSTKGINADVKVNINGVETEIVNEVMSLGVTVDENRNWKLHIIYIKTKISVSCSVI